MIKQIVDFSRDDQGRAAVIEVFMLVEDPQAHIEAIKALAEDGAIIQSADADTIRAVYRGTNQDKLLSLLADGWSFEGRDDPDALQCQDQADCGECMEPCGFREGEE
jgi:hypothetical protein